MKIQKRQTSISPQKTPPKKPASFRVKSKQHSSTIYNSLPLKETAFKGFCESPKWVKPDSLSRVQLLLQKLTLSIVPFSVYSNNKTFTCFFRIFERLHLNFLLFSNLNWSNAQKMGPKFCWRPHLLAGKFTWAKHCWVMSTNSCFLKICWQCPAMFCLYTSSKISRP